MLAARPRRLETVALTALALIAFAANSILTRMALAPGHIDAAGFTTVRLATGALMLVVLVRAGSASWSPLRGRPGLGSLALFAYAAPFTFAYLRIGAAVGALVLFGAVQLTMIGWGVAHGERPGPRTWAGLALAAGGLMALLLPSASRPDPLGFALMVVAGVAWGAYSLLGKRVGDPLAANARGFLWSVPLALVLYVLTLRSSSLGARGVVLASLSGAVTSGLGYAIWYRALRGLTATQAGILQLCVPVLAAVAAVVVLDERATARLAGAGLAVLGGVALALTSQNRRGGRAT
jgi:drug/metabolite transporter (DMT)-like permease